MSLLLRKACEPILKKAKLDNYHVEIAADGKYLQIASECGKPIIAIFGIRFSSFRVTKNEILYCTELLEAFLVTHKAHIDQFLLAVQKLSVTNKAIINAAKYDIKSYAYRFNGQPYIQYIDQVFKICLTADEQSYVSVSSTVNLTFEGLTKYVPSKKLYAEMLKIIGKHTKYTVALNVVDDLSTELAKCDI